MNDDCAIQAQIDQLNAIQRDHAEWCKGIHDSYIVAGFSPDHAFDLLMFRLHQLDGFYATD